MYLGQSDSLSWCQHSIETILSLKGGVVFQTHSQIHLGMISKELAPSPVYIATQTAAINMYVIDFCKSYIAMHTSLVVQQWAIVQ